MPKQRIDLREPKALATDVDVLASLKEGDSYRIHAQMA